MNWSKYSALKSAQKIAFEKVAEQKDSDGNVVTPASIDLVETRFDMYTGEALDNIRKECTLRELESEKARCDREVAVYQLESDEIAKAIEDFKKL